MRIILFLFLLIGAGYYLAFREGALLREPILAVQSAASYSWSAMPWPGRRAEQALQAERERSTYLDKTLADLRGELVRVTALADTRGEAVESARRSMASKDGDAAAEHARVQALSDELASLKQDMTAQADRLREQVDRERADGQAARHEGDLARERLSQADLRLAGADAVQASLQEQVRAQAKAVLDEQERSRGLADQLDRARHDAADRIAALQGQLDAAQRQLAKGDGRPAPDDRAPADVDQASAALPEPQEADRAGPGRYHLPNAVPTRVVVRYAPDSASAKAHAISLCGRLQSQGVMIEQVVEAPSPVQANSIGFFYGSDESRASRIAALLPELRSGIHHHPVTDSIPRPGLIEIEIAT